MHVHFYPAAYFHLCTHFACLEMYIMLTYKRVLYSWEKREGRAVSSCCDTHRKNVETLKIHCIIYVETRLKGLLSEDERKKNILYINSCTQT